MRRSKIWKYYEKLDHKTAECQLCEKVIKTSGNTSNLMKHLKTHPQIDVNDNDSIVVRGMFKREASESTKRRSANKSATTPNRPLTGHILTIVKSESKNVSNNMEFGAHDVIEFEESSMDETRNAIQNVVHHKVGGAWTTNVDESDDIIEYEPSLAGDPVAISNELSELQATQASDGDGDDDGGDEDENGENDDMDALRQQLNEQHDHLIRFLCTDQLPMTTIAGKGFKRFIHTLCPTYRLPTIEVVGARITQLANAKIDSLRPKFAAMQSISLSAAIYGEDEQTCLEVTAHYHENQKCQSRTLCAQLLSEFYTTHEIIEIIKSTCQRFNIEESKITCVVTKGNPTLGIGIASWIGSQRHLPCLGQIFYKMLKSFMERCEVAPLTNKVRRFMESREQPVDIQKIPVTTFEMLERYTLTCHHLDVDDDLALSSSDLELCKQLIALVKPIISAIRTLCQSSGVDESEFPSASEALPIVFTIINEMKQVNSNEHKTIFDLRTYLVEQLRLRFDEMEKNMLWAMSCLLDPRFRNVPFQSGTLLAKYMSRFYDLQQHFDDTDTEEGSSPSSSGNTFWKSFQLMSYEKQKVTNAMGNDNDDEIATYFCSQVSSLQVGPMLLWQDLSQFHPFLFSVAKKYLHIPATALAPSRIFTTSGQEVTTRRIALQGDHMNAMIILGNDELTTQN